MENPVVAETEQQMARLTAENEVLKQLLQEEQQIAAIKTQQQRELETKAAEGAETKSYLDLQTDELKRTRQYVTELMQRADAAVQRELDLEKQVTLSASTSHQLEEIKSKYNHLTVQLDDLSERLQQLSVQNTIQSQYAGRIAELECMLANAEEEIEKLKNPAEEDIP